MSFPHRNPFDPSFSGTSSGLPNGMPNGMPTGYPPVPARPVSSGESRRSRIRVAIGYAIGFLVIIWGVQIVNMAMGGALVYFGIHPLDVSSLWHIFTSPLIHGSLAHIMSNSLPGALFVFLVALSGRRAFWEVTLIACIVGGIGTWFFGGVGTSHIGASGLIYGWLAYLVVRGLFNRSLSQFVLGLVLTFFYGGLIWGVLPNESGVSWQAHLFGGIGGVIAGAVITSDDPVALVTKRQQRQQRKLSR